MIRPYTVPDDVFASLAAGGGGAGAMRFLVRTQRSKHLLLLRLVVATAERIGHPHAKALASAYELLAGLQADRPSKVEPLLRHPPVGAWAIRALRDLRSGADPDHGYLTALAASAALLARADCTVEVPLDDDRVFLPFLGRAQLSGTGSVTTATVRSRPESGEIVTANAGTSIPQDPRLDGEGWQGIRRLRVDAAGAAASFLLDDLDPYRLPGGRTSGRVDAVAFGQWQRTLDDAWALLAAHHPETAEETAAGITALVPLRSLPGHELSETSRHAFGAVALSQPSSDRSSALALAHERMHAKLCALLDLVALLNDPGEPRWYAPWRDDARPLGALLQGAYAHLGVADFWRRQRHLDTGEAALQAQAEFARWHAGTRAVVATLQGSGALTEHGARFVDGMAATLDAWADERIPAGAVAQAHTAAARHREVWQRRHGAIDDVGRLKRE